jgi:hypothetical protein
MLVNTVLYIREQLFNTKYGIIINNDEKSMRLIYDFINDNEFTNDSYLSLMDTKIVNFKKQLGGDIMNIKLENNQIYHYDVKRLTSKKNKEQNICFANIRNSDYNCLCFTYYTKETKDTKDTKNTTLILNDLNATEDCITCKDSKNKYKIGDILMQIFLQWVKNHPELSHIKRIELQDNSTKKCYGIGLKLLYLKTITDGIPFYAKYGFRPIEATELAIFRYNRNKFKENILLNNEIVDKIFEDTINKNNKKPYETYVNLYKKLIINTNPIDIKLLIRNMIDLGNNEIASIDKRKYTCELVFYVLKKLYKILGYKEYDDEKWFLNIK